MNLQHLFVPTSLVLFIVLSVSACVNIKQRESMQSALQDGRIGDALVLAEQHDKKDVLSSLNKAMLRRIKGDYEVSNHYFETAKQKIDSLYGVSISEQAGAMIVNDTLRDYSGDRYEQVLLHAYMAMNYIQLDDLDAARVEMLQANVKMQEWGEQPEEDPFVRYLAGMIYEALGETDEALISYRKAKEAYVSSKQATNKKIPSLLRRDLLQVLSKENLNDELRLLKNEFNMQQFKSRNIGKGYGELVVILNSSLAPIRKEVSIVANTSGEVVDTVKIAVPSYPQPKQQFSARLSSAQNVSANLEMVENVDALARVALQSDLPIITTRAIARAIVKHGTQDKAKKKGGAVAGFLATVVNVATERADTRSWTTLPQTIQMARVRLPEGNHDITIEIYNASGMHVDSIKKDVYVKSGKIAFLTEHWVAPNMSLHVVSNK